MNPDRWWVRFLYWLFDIQSPSKIFFGEETNKAFREGLREGFKKGVNREDHT